MRRYWFIIKDIFNCFCQLLQTLRENCSLTMRIMIFFLLSLLICYIFPVFINDFLICKLNEWNLLTKVDLLVGVISKYQLLTVTPFLITLFYFFYRQQRQIAESYVLRLEIGNFTIFFSLLLLVGNLRLGMYDVSRMAGLAAVVYFTSLLWIFLFVRYIFKQIHASVLRENFHQAIMDSLHCWGKLSRWHFLEKVLLDRLAWRLEVFYQIEFYMIKNNMSVIKKR